MVYYYLTREFTHDETGSRLLSVWAGGKADHANS